jgi:hypothetical protein
MEHLFSLLLTTPYLLPVLLTVLAVLVVWFGLPRASRYRQPDRWRLGIILTSAGLMAIWLLPAGVVIYVNQREIKWILFILALVCGAGVLGGGLQALSKANNTARDDQWDSMFG